MELSRSRFRAHLIGLGSCLPGWPALVRHQRRRGRKASAGYCYSVWMKHLMVLFNNGLASRPRTVVEIGPGDSLGIGICALMSGAERYVAVDAVKQTDPADNLPMVDEIAGLFARQAPIADDEEFLPFPVQLIDAGIIRPATEDRLQDIRNALLTTDNADSRIIYLDTLDQIGRAHV